MLHACVVVACYMLHDACCAISALHLKNKQSVVLHVYIKKNVELVLLLSRTKHSEMSDKSSREVIESELMNEFTKDSDSKWPEWHKFNGGVQIIYPSYLLENLFMPVRCYCYNLFRCITEMKNADKYMCHLAQELCDYSYGHVAYHIHNGHLDYLLMELKKLLLPTEQYTRNVLYALDEAILGCSEMLARHDVTNLFGMELEDYKREKEDKDERHAN